MKMMKKKKKTRSRPSHWPLYPYLTPPSNLLNHINQKIKSRNLIRFEPRNKSHLHLPPPPPLTMPMTLLPTKSSLWHNPLHLLSSSTNTAKKKYQKTTPLMKKKKTRRRPSHQLQNVYLTRPRPSNPILKKRKREKTKESVEKEEQEEDAKLVVEKKELEPNSVPAGKSPSTTTNSAVQRIWSVENELVLLYALSHHHNT